MNGVQTRLKCKPNVKRCKRFVFAAHSPLLHPNTLKTKAIIHFQTDHILTRFVFPPLYASTAKVDGKPLLEIIGTPALTAEQWAEIQSKVTKGGANIINLRGRSSFQSPAYVSIEMIAAAMGGKPFRWPAGTYVHSHGFDHIMMAMETEITKDGVHYKELKGTPEEEAKLKESYAHLCKLRDEVIGMGVLPAIKDWKSINPNID